MGRRRKKTKKDRPEAAGASEAVSELEEAAISRRGKKTIAAGIGLLIVGFIILTFTDREGQNWAATLSPLLILGAYGVIAAGIFLPEGGESAPAGENTTKDDAAAAN